MNIDIIPLAGDDEWSYGGWRITKEANEYTLHSPDAETTPARMFHSQEEALRRLECEVNFQAELVLESPAMRAMYMEGVASLTKLYAMRRVPGEAHCHILEGPGKRGDLLAPRNDLYDHSPTGIEWGYAGSGPAQLALGILADALGSDRLAVRLHQRFKFEWVAPWNYDDHWMISQLQVACWAVEYIRAERRAPVSP